MQQQRPAPLRELDSNAPHLRKVENATRLPARPALVIDLFSEDLVGKGPVDTISDTSPNSEGAAPLDTEFETATVQEDRDLGHAESPATTTPSIARSRRESELPELNDARSLIGCDDTVFDVIQTIPETPGGKKQKMRSLEGKRRQEGVYSSFNEVAKDLLRAYTELQVIKQTGADTLNNSARKCAQSVLEAKWGATEAAALQAANDLHEYYARRGRKFHMESGFFIALPLAYYLKFTRPTSKSDEIEDKIREFTPYIRLSHRGVLRAEADGAAEMWKIEEWLRDQSFWVDKKGKSAAPLWIRKPLKSI